MTNAAPAFKTRTFSALRSLANKEPRGGLIDGVPLLPQSGVVLIVGDPLSGKSSFCTFVAVAMALGDSLGGSATVPDGRTTWLAGEHTLRGVAEKFVRSCKGEGVAPTATLDGWVDFGAESTWTLDSADDVQKLGGHLDANGTDVVVLDSFRRFSTADENSSQSVADALNQVRALACSQETGAANRLVAVIHHLGRNGLPRGSTDFTAVVDSTLRVERRAGGWRLRAEHHGAAPFSCDAVVTETDEVLHVEDFLPLACAQGPLGTAALRKQTRACGGSAKNGHIDARVAELVLTGAVRTQAGPRGSVLHTLAPPP